MNNKKVKILIVLSLLFFLIFGAAQTFGLFESKVDSSIDNNIAEWNIEINDTNISNGITDTFVIDKMTYMNKDSNVRTGKFAPGIKGYYDLNIDPTDTNVSIKYELILDDSEFENDYIEISSVELIEGNDSLVKKDDNTYVGMIPVNDKKVNKIRIYVEWINNEDNNEIDSEIGTRENPDLHIPVTVNVTQYLGEELI